MEALKNEKVLAVDFEWQVDIKPGDNHKLSLAQVSSATHCYIWCLFQFQQRPEGLFALLSDSKITKVGCGMRGSDMQKLAISGLAVEEPIVRQKHGKPTYNYPLPSHFIDIQDFKYQGQKLPFIGLDHQAALFLRKQLPHVINCTKAKWHTITKDERVRRYAALDAYATYLVYMAQSTKSYLEPLIDPVELAILRMPLLTLRHKGEIPTYSVVSAPVPSSKASILTSVSAPPTPLPDAAPGVNEQPMPLHPQIHVIADSSYASSSSSPNSARLEHAEMRRETASQPPNANASSSSSRSQPALRQGPSNREGGRKPRQPRFAPKATSTSGAAATPAFAPNSASPVSEASSSAPNHTNAPKQRVSPPPANSSPNQGATRTAKRQRANMPVYAKVTSPITPNQEPVTELNSANSSMGNKASPGPSQSTSQFLRSQPRPK